MKANEKLLLRLLESSDTNFVIPVYQRNYDWKKEHCKQLFDDFVNVIENDYKTHFFGTIVSIYNDSARGREYLIIDGQQRITTISLILLAIYNILNKGRLKSNNIIKEKIVNQYLINQYVDDDRKFKLKPIKDDQIAFEKIFNNDEDSILESNITTNYHYFYNKILEGSLTIEEIYLAIEKLMIVEIELKSGEDDPQLIFESLNSTGLDLSDADKVRNFILMGQPSQIQEELYNNYWNKIEIRTLYKVTNFIRDYITMKENKIPNIKKIYISFKLYVNENELDIFKCLEDMLTFSQYYNKVLTNNVGLEPANEIIKRINSLEVTVLYPFLMEVLADYYNDILSDNDLIEILLVLESYIFRRIMCGVATNALNKVFMNIGKEIKKYSNFEEQYVEIFKHIIVNKRSSQRIPNDEEFKKNFYDQEIYSWKSKNKIYILERLENYDNHEKVAIENLVASNDLTLEHIMPQTLNRSWKETLGKKFEEIHEMHLHTIGNLTLTGYNSSLSNRSFVEKRDMEKGFKESRLKLNRYLSSINKFTEEEIIDRKNILFNIGLEIWKYPKTSFIEEREVENLYNLTDEDDFTNTTVKSFTLLGDEYKVKNWTQLYEEVCLTLYDLEPSNFAKLVQKRFLEAHIGKRFSETGDDLRDGFKIAKKVYIEKNLNTQAKLDTIRVIFDEYDLDYNELSYYIG